MRTRRGGFTLLEVLVAIGAVALVSVGLAALLDAVGKTLSGGRRTSFFNQLATQVELQMRRDFANMSREGVLLVRHQYAGDPQSFERRVRLASEQQEDDNDPTYRVRRVDELMFFTGGDFSSTREPLDPRFVPRASYARVYYGHGVRMRPGADPVLYSRPDPWSKSYPGNNPSPDFLGRNDDANPNAYASSWTLLRYLTLLAPPQTSETLADTATVFGLTRDRLSDKDGQVRLQPATASVLRRLADLVPNGLRAPQVPAPSTQTYIRWDMANGLRPRFESGLVDIAATDLPTLRMEILTLANEPAQTTGLLVTAQNGLVPARFDVDPSGTFVPSPPSDTPNPPTTTLRRQQRWMAQAWPTNADADVPSTLTADVAGTRIRYEDSPPGFTDAVLMTEGSDAERMIKAYRLADQRMLTSSVFVPRCTEFIVEWSFGDVNTNPASPEFNQMVWYGTTRPTGGAGSMPDFERYGGGTVQGRNLHNFFPPQRDGVVRWYPVAPRLVYGADRVTNPRPGEALETYFGYVDPEFRANGSAVPTPAPTAIARTSGVARPLSSNPLTVWSNAAVDTVPMAWPKFIRVTMRIADPQNSLSEETFQFVFPVPGSSAVEYADPDAPAS